ncbi:Uncharacterized protein T4E_10150 [Trichinella pseudospiralis]|uniref:Fukutin n=1 Tax=Trichinella pseudospiralis TaxID=6337 RepID=A0A0V0YMN2_TRIPS|nr:Uncharacterized protein T4E_10150 [Trichinella pseudospiralis]
MATKLHLDHTSKWKFIGELLPNLPNCKNLHMRHRRCFWVISVIAIITSLFGLFTWTPHSAFSHRFLFARLSPFVSICLESYCSESVDVDVLRNAEILDFTFRASRSKLKFVVLDPDCIACASHTKSAYCLLATLKQSYLFGVIGAEHFDNLTEIVKYFHNSAWKVKSGEERLTFQHNTTRVHVVRIDRRDKYWFIPSLKEVGFKAHAFRNFKIDNIHFANWSLYIPGSEVMKQWSDAEFLECNRSSAKRIQQMYLGKYEQVLKNTVINGMALFRDVLQGIGIRSMLFGGTLLGWYRDCGIIPYTTDMDMASFASEYSTKLLGTLASNKDLKLYWQLGKVPSDSLELSVFYDGMKIDLFFLYEEGSTHWAGGMIVYERRKLRWTYPKVTKLCSAELLGELFSVPCNVLAILMADYGETWYDVYPNENFTWYASHKNVKKLDRWSKKEWPLVYHIYMSQKKLK